MKPKINKPKHAVTENDEYFYRDQEMYRATLEPDLLLEPNSNQNLNQKKHN